MILHKQKKDNKTTEQDNATEKQTDNKITEQENATQKQTDNKTTEQDNSKQSQTDNKSEQTPKENKYMIYGKNAFPISTEYPKYPLPTYLNKGIFIDKESTNPYFENDIFPESFYYIKVSQPSLCLKNLRFFLYSYL